MRPTHLFVCLIAAITIASSSPEPTSINSNTTSHVTDLFRTVHQCWPHDSPFLPATIRILYDVNPSEGFNLRRDVYLRLAVFLRKVQAQPGWRSAKLVLPPFRNLYHWQSTSHTSATDVSYFWNHYFELGSLAAYADVLDMWQFFDSEQSDATLQVVQLRGYRDMFENGQFVEKFELAKHPIRVQRPISSVMGYGNLSQSAGGWMWPSRFQGSAMQLQSMVELVWRRAGMPRHLRVMVRNAEVTLHDGFGDAEFWRARRSMRFADALVAEAEEFRRDVMGESGAADGVQRPERWQDEKVLFIGIIVFSFLYMLLMFSPIVEPVAVNICVRICDVATFCTAVPGRRRRSRRRRNKSKTSWPLTI